MEYERVAAAVASIRERHSDPIELGMMLGTGLGDLPVDLDVAVRLRDADITGFPNASAPGHSGDVILGSWRGRAVAVLQGRFHLYEGWAPADVALPVYVLRELGAHTLVLTNAAGGLNAGYAPGDVMLIDDHINLTGFNPLTGPNDDRLGRRFPDMTDAYALRYRTLLSDAATRAGVRLRRGVYAGVAGPSMETSAERRFLRHAGGDAVGMSTVHEAIAANHCGLAVLGLSAITNMATGGADQASHTLDDILGNAAVAGATIWRLLGLTLDGLTG